MSRFPFVAVLLAAAVAVTLSACSAGGSGKGSDPFTSTTVTVAPRSTSSTSTTTTTAEPTGACGNQGDAITAAIEGSSVAGLDQLHGQFTVQRCRIAASEPTWAAASLVPNPGVQLDGATVVLQRNGGVWTVEDVGTSNTGCDAPANVISDLGLSCF